ncbi:hypothetical protein CCH79_00018453, partial [Gambusia affinis]
YVVTFSPLLDTKEDPQAIIIWDILTGQKKRGFHCESSAHWPIFKWSHDGKFFARMTTDTLSIYETPSMGLLDKKSLKISGIKDFSWSPGDNIIAFWVPEDKDIPARVTLMQLPSRQEIRVRNLFNVVDCKLHWQRNGDYLCVKVDRTPKGTQGVVTNFEIFRMREKQVPVDVVEMKESIIAFAWEPNGSKFAVLHGESPRINASFYHVKNNGKIELIKMFDKQQANSIFWSPQGQFMVLAGLRSMNGALAFVDTSDCTMMNIAEHYMASDVEWDPTGRYVVTSVSWWSHKVGNTACWQTRGHVDNAYWMWTFQGRLLQKINKDRFCQLLWRPRPPTVLTSDQIKMIKKDLKKYSKIFEQKDRLSQSKASKPEWGQHTPERCIYKEQKSVSCLQLVRKATNQAEQEAHGVIPFGHAVGFRIKLSCDLPELGEDLVYDILEFFQPLRPHLRDVVHHNHRVNPVGLLGFLP